MAPVVYLDTHILVWLAQGMDSKLSRQARRLIEHEDLMVSPIVRLELAYLYEIGRLRLPPDSFLPELVSHLGLRYCDVPTEDIVTEAIRMSWTRDPFDRMITAAAAHRDARLVTADQSILDHYSKGVW